MHGENDQAFQSATETLKQIPTHEVLTIKNASHACYRQQPLDFHNGLRQFLYSVYRPIYVEQYKKRAESAGDAYVLSATAATNTTKLNVNRLNKSDSDVIVEKNQVRAPKRTI